MDPLNKMVGSQQASHTLLLQVTTTMRKLTIRLTDKWDANGRQGGCRQEGSTTSMSLTESPSTGDSSLMQLPQPPSPTKANDQQTPGSYMNYT
jgi:hypothetical protein